MHKGACPCGAVSFAVVGDLARLTPATGRNAAKCRACLGLDGRSEVGRDDPR